MGVLHAQTQAFSSVDGTAVKNARVEVFCANKPREIQHERVPPSDKGIYHTRVIRCGAITISKADRYMQNRQQHSQHKRSTDRGVRERGRQDEGQRRQQQEAHIGDRTGGIEVLFLVLQTTKQEATPQHQQHVREDRPEQRRLSAVGSRAAKRARNLSRRHKQK